METLLTLPRLGETMEEGVVAGWLIAPGDRFERGQTIVEVESDKTVVEYPALQSGRLIEILAEPGSRVPVGAPIARIAVDGEAAAAAAAQAPPAEAPTAEPATPHTGPDGLPVARPAGPRVAASPAARRLARDRGIDLAAVPATGRRGRVSVADVDAWGGETPVAGGRLIPVTGGVLAVMERGQGPAIPAVFLHGFGGTGTVWAMQAGPLARRRRVIRPDLPGHGGSSAWDGPLDAQGLCALVGDLLDAVAAPRVHLIGHSFGGAIAAAFAVSAPDRVASLTLAAPAVFGPDDDPGFVRRLPQAADIDDVRAAMAMLYPDPAALAEGDVRATAAWLVRPGARETLGRLVEDGITSLGRLRLRRGIGALSCPVATVWGGLDRITPAHHGQGLPGTVAVHVFGGTGHMIPVDAPQDLATVIARTLAAGDAEPG